MGTIFEGGIKESFSLQRVFHPSSCHRSCERWVSATTLAQQGLVFDLTLPILTIGSVPIFILHATFELILSDCNL
jgi:hypothetical protein